MHKFYWNFVILEVFDVSNFFSIFQLKSRVERLLQDFLFILKNWRLKVEGSYSYFWRLKVLVLAFVVWMFIFVFEGWSFVVYVSWNVYLHILNLKNLKKSFNFLKSSFVKCDLQWWRICEGWNVFDENYLVAFIFVFKHLDFWGGRLNWNKVNIFTHILFLCIYDGFCCSYVIKPNFDNGWKHN